jgi:hypothetical protein
VLASRTYVQTDRQTGRRHTETLLHIPARIPRVMHMGEFKTHKSSSAGTSVSSPSESLLPLPSTSYNLPYGAIGLQLARQMGVA